MKTIFYLFFALLFSHRVFAQSIFWTGATDTDWGTGANWSTNVVPTAADNVFVPGSLTRYPVLNSTTSIKSLAVQSGSLLTINAGSTLTISGAGVGYSIDLAGTIQNNGTIAIIATSDAVYLQGNAQLNNNTGATLSVTTTGNYGVKIFNSGILTNQTEGMATITGNSGSVFLSGANTPTEMVKNYGKMTLSGQIEKYTDTFHNYPCGVVNLMSGEVYNNGGQIINEGFFSAPANLNGTAADFINDGIIYIGGGSASYTNNKIRIFNNADATGIFGFGTSNDLTVAGIYKDEAATLSAGGYNQATNTFTHFGLAAGSQTLYAKITRPGGTCPQIVPFTFEVPTASTFTTQPIDQTVCPGSLATFTVVIANAASYQWQLNTGSGWNNVPTAAPYSNTTTATLNISNVTGLNGYQYRCFVTGPGGATLTSNAATLTISAGGGSNPTGLLTWTGSVDTDWNTPCNWSPASVPTATNDVVIPNTTNKPIINTAAVAKSVEVQTGAVLTIAATKGLTINGSRLVSFASAGLYNAGTIHNNGQLILGNTGSVGDLGILSIGTFNNNTGAEITIDRATSQGVVNTTGGVFANAGKMTIGASASVGFVGLVNQATFNNNTGGEITINRSSSSGLYNSVGGTFTNAAKILIGTTTPTRALGLENRAIFINNAGGEITINNTTAFGLINANGNLSLDPPGNFTNAGKISIGATALSSIGLTNSGSATFNNNTGGEIKIDRSTSVGLQNEVNCIFNNAGKITIGATASVGNEGIRNSATFNNNTGGEITINNSTNNGLRNLGGTFTNVAKITIGAMASVGAAGLYNYAVFNNNTGGEIKIDNATGAGVENEIGTFNNTSKIVIGFTSSTGSYGIHNRDGATFDNSSGSEITIDRSTVSGLINIRTGTFTNAGKINIGATASVGIYGLANAFTSSFTNNPGGIITLDNSSSSGLTAFAGSILTNTATIIIGATASTGAFGLANDGTINNNACGKLIVASGTFQSNASRTITNAGLIQVANSLENNGTFTNNGVLKYGSLTGTVTNATNSSLIVNNTPTPIFTYGGSYDGVINGIFTAMSALPGESAGAFTAPNTFVPSGLPSGSQTLYAKITPQGGACSFVVPFTYFTCSAVSVSVTGATSICAGSSTTLSPAAGGIWSSSNPGVATVTNAGIVTGVAEGVVNFTFNSGGCSSTTSNITIKPVPGSNLTASQTDVCANTEVTLNAHCSIPAATVNWNPGAPTVTPNAATLPYLYKASCTANGCTGNESSVEVRTHRILVDMKDLDVGTLPLPVARAVKDNMAPTNVIEAPVFPRRWTFIANGCDASESAVFKLSGPVNFSSIDNAPPYAMFANDVNGFYSLDHPNYGNGGSFPNGNYTLTIDLRNADGVGGPFPKNRVATGSLLATRTLEFTVANPSSLVRVAAGLETEFKEDNWLNIGQNPVNEEVIVRLSGKMGEEIQLALVNLQGQPIQQKSIRLSSGQQDEVLNVRNVTSGLYILKAVKGDRAKTIKVVKVN